MTGDEMVGWHHQLKGHEFEQALGAAVHRVAEPDTTEQLNRMSYDCVGDVHLMRCRRSFST